MSAYLTNAKVAWREHVAIILEAGKLLEREMRSQRMKCCFHSYILEYKFNYTQQINIKSVHGRERKSKEIYQMINISYTSHTILIPQTTCIISKYTISKQFFSSQHPITDANFYHHINLKQAQSTYKIYGRDHFSGNQLIGWCAPLTPA